MKWLIAIVLAPILLFIILLVLLYLPPVQNWAVKQVANYASEKTGLEISLEHVSLSFPLDLKLEGFKMLRPNDSIPQRKDTVADVKELLVDVQLIPLFSNQVEIDKLTFKNLKANTMDYIGDLQIRGDLQRFQLTAHGIDLNNSAAILNSAEMADGFLDIALNDTMPKDTTKKKTLWKINVEKLNLYNTALKLHMPGDTMVVGAKFGRAALTKTNIDLLKKSYRVQSLNWQSGMLTYDMMYQKRAKQGFDAAHISMTDLNLGVDSLAYDSTGIAANIRTANFKEKSGLIVNDLRTNFRLDANRFYLTPLYLRMPNTELRGNFIMDLNAFADKNPGKFKINLDGFTHKNDLHAFLTSVPKRVMNALPSQPIMLNGKVEGNMKALTFTKLHTAMPTHFDITTNGTIANFQETALLRANLAVRGKAQDLGFIKKMLPAKTAKTFNLPRNMAFDAKVNARGKQYFGNVFLKESGGNIYAKGSYNTANDVYALTARANNFHINHFVPNEDIKPFTGTIVMSGHGTDFLNPKSALRLKLNIGKFAFGKYVLDGFGGDISLNSGIANAHIVSTNKMIGGNFTYRGKLSDKAIDGRLRGWLHRIDLKRLGVMKDPWVVSTWADVNVKSNLKDYHFIKGPVRHFSLTSEERHGTKKLIAGDFDVVVNMIGKQLDTHLKGNLDYANLKALGVMDKQYVVKTDANIHFHSNMKDTYKVEGYLGKLRINEHRGKDIIALFAGDLNINADMKGKYLAGSTNGNVQCADLYQLGIVDKPFVSNFSTNIEFETDGADNLKMRGILGNLQVQTANEHYAPGDVTLDVLSRKDTTRAVINSGDFVLNTEWQGSYQHVLKQGQRISTDLGKQIENKRIDQSLLQAQLPIGHLKLKSGEGNLFSKILEQQGYSFKSADIDLTSSPSRGLNGNIFVDSLAYNDVQVDSMLIDLTTNATGLNYAMQILNNGQNKYPYKGFLRGNFFERGVNTSLIINDMNDKTALALAAEAAMKGDGINLSLTSAKAVLGYKNFTVNQSNYLYIGRDKRLSADMKLNASDGAGLHLYTEDEDSTALQDFTVSVHKFELKELMDVLPFAPKLSGELNGDYYVVQTTQNLSISSDMRINNMVYEMNKMGNLGAEFVYMPKGDDSHYIDAIISKDGNEVGTLKGTYSNVGKGSLDAEFNMNKFPLNYINGFIPDRIVGLRGTGEGTLDIQGPLNQLDINGEMYLDSSYVFSEPYGFEMRFANDPVLIKNSRIEFENFEVFANNNQPLNVQGYLDFANFDRIATDLQLRTRNFLIINSKENLRSELYGKAFIDFDGRIKGLLSALHLDGKLNVLGTTDVTYMMRDAQLTTDTELEDLVTFTNLNDTTTTVVKRPDIQGFSMNLDIEVEDQTHAMCILNPERTNYVDLIGGGTFKMAYDPTNGARMRGRYTIGEGKMKYSLPIIPLRTFEIQPGSYVEFTGNPSEPTLSIKATEHVKSTVSDGTGSGRLVDFETGVSLTKKFPNPGVEFIIDAPEDQEMQNLLKTKSLEERSKLAVTMLASGIYFDGENGATANAAMNSALMGFLQNQVNSITGRALNSMGVNLTANMESAADATGSLHTDYTFKFSKRLWDNRLRIIIGGRVSTGSQMSEQNGAFFDNFSLEYRLNKKETQYLKLYYEREAYDWLEGNQGEFGLGVMWRRKLQHFKDIFRFKKDKEVPQKRDSLINFVNE